MNHEIYQIRLRMHNKKAKRDVPRLQARLNALFKEKDETMRNNIQGLPMPARTPRLCSICNERIGRGYHICKPGQWKKGKAQDISPQ